jgi:hypothetical protein
MRMRFNFRKHFGEENGMFVVYTKIKEHIDLLFITVRFVFLHRPLHLSFLGDFWHAIRAHVHITFTKNQIFYFICYF